MLTILTAGQPELADVAVQGKPGEDHLSTYQSYFAPAITREEKYKYIDWLSIIDQLGEELVGGGEFLMIKIQ